MTVWSKITWPAPYVPSLLLFLHAIVHMQAPARITHSRRLEIDADDQSHSRSLKRYAARLAQGAPETDDPRDVAEELLMELESKRDADLAAVTQEAGDAAAAAASIESVAGLGKRARKARRRAARKEAGESKETTGAGAGQGSKEKGAEAAPVRHSTSSVLSAP
jgi:hypothetical protein